LDILNELVSTKTLSYGFKCYTSITFIPDMQKIKVSITDLKLKDYGYLILVLNSIYPIINLELEWCVLDNTFLDSLCKISSLKTLTFIEAGGIDSITYSLINLFEHNTFIKQINKLKIITTGYYASFVIMDVVSKFIEKIKRMIQTKNLVIDNTISSFQFPIFVNYIDNILLIFPKVQKLLIRILPFSKEDEERLNKLILDHPCIKFNLHIFSSRNGETNENILSHYETIYKRNVCKLKII
jgi:hypothetical protein